MAERTEFPPRPDVWNGRRIIAPGASVGVALALAIVADQPGDIAEGQHSGENMRVHCQIAGVSGSTPRAERWCAKTSLATGRYPMIVN